MCFNIGILFVSLFAAMLCALILEKSNTAITKLLALALIIMCGIAILIAGLALLDPIGLNELR